MASSEWSEPLPAPTESLPSLPPASPDWLSTPQGELSFFRSIVCHRLVGPEKHFHVLAVVQDIRNHSGKSVDVDQVWEKYREVYDEKVLETTWAEQELAAVEGDEAEQIENGTMPSFTEEDDANLSLFLPNPEQSDKVYGRSFPRTEFSLEPEENLLSTAFERGKRTSEDREESPVDAPLKEVFYEPIEEEEEKKVEVEERTRMTRSPRKRVATEKAQAAIASPRRKKAKPTNHTEEDSGSELSDLTDDEEEEEDEEDEGEEGEGTAGEDADSNLEEGTVASQIDEEEEEEEPEPTGRKRKAAASRKPPPSKRRNARSASVATSDSRTAAERRKDQSTPSTRGRGRGAGGSGKKPVGRPPKKK